MDKKEAMARLDAIEAEAKKLREIIEAPEKVEPWVPKKPTLCWRWDGENRPAICRPSIITDFDGEQYLDLLGVHWHHAIPLTRAEALAMIDEPSRYPWDKAPEWAKWAATDASGDTTWFSLLPVVDETCAQWNNTNGGVYTKIQGGTRPCPDWRESLEARP